MRSDCAAGEGTHEGLCTDFYELTMLSAYFERGMEERAVFEFFVRSLPRRRNFLVAAGLEQLVEYLERLEISAADIAWLESTGRFDRRFLERLAGLRFTGDVDALPEGTVFFANEPVVRVSASLPQAQLIESRLINLLHFQTLIASKAARCVIAARGRTLVDFGLRRAHGAEAGVLASRASYLAGFDGTATVEAGRRFAIPLFGTMAHSFVQAHRSESEAFRHFAESFPDANTLLIDTFDTPRAALRVVELARELRSRGRRIQAVRIDSGDLAHETAVVRRILDEGGCPEIGIFLSGGLDESIIDGLLARGVAADGFGLGTSLDVSSDAPALDCAYKLQEYAGRATRKRSSGKMTWPGSKQVVRHRDERATFVADQIVLADDPASGERLLVPVMRNGRRVSKLPTVQEARVVARRELERLPAGAHSLTSAFHAAVEVAPAILELAESLDRADRAIADNTRGSNAQLG